MSLRVEYEPQPVGRRRLAANAVSEADQSRTSVVPWLVVVVVLVVAGVVWGQLQADPAAPSLRAGDEGVVEVPPPPESQHLRPSRFARDEEVAAATFYDNPRALAGRLSLQSIAYSPRGQVYCRARINHALVGVGDSLLDGEFFVEAIRPTVVIVRDATGSLHRLVDPQAAHVAAEIYGWNLETLVEPHASPQLPAGQRIYTTYGVSYATTPDTQQAIENEILAHLNQTGRMPSVTQAQAILQRHGITENLDHASEPTTAERFRELTERRREIDRGRE